MTAVSFDAGVADFQQKVLDTSRRVPVLVDFWAEWCAPCRVLKPVLEKLAAEYGGRFLLAKVNSDQNQEIAARYGVRGIPNVKAFIDGEMVDEFTGALPEAQVRAFIDRLMPSPAEPLRIAAREARAKGEHDVAMSLLADAAELDPASEVVQLDLAEIFLDMKNVDAARAILDAYEHKARDLTRLRSMLARLKLATTSASADPAVLLARIDTDPGDLDARLQLATALAVAHDYRPALEQLLEIVRRDRKWRDDAGRKAMLDLFNLLSGDKARDELVREFRIKLSRTLN